MNPSMFHLLANLRRLFQKTRRRVDLICHPVSSRMILPHFRLGNCLIYRVFVPSTSLIQVGTVLATGYFEEGTSMKDSPIPASNRTILVVDDNPDIVTIVKTILEVKGYGVQSAYSGQEVFNLLGELKPDLIILDIMMPEMDGLKVLTRLKGDAGTASIPVILLTAKVKHDDVLGGYKMGADYYITKPFTITQLMTGINSLLSKDQGDSVESP